MSTYFHLFYQREDPRFAFTFFALLHHCRWYKITVQGTLSAFSLNRHVLLVVQILSSVSNLRPGGAGSKALMNKTRQPSVWRGYCSWWPCNLPKSISNLHQTCPGSVPFHCLLVNYASHTWLWSLTTMLRFLQPTMSFSVSQVSCSYVIPSYSSPSFWHSWRGEKKKKPTPKAPTTHKDSCSP